MGAIGALLLFIVPTTTTLVLLYRLSSSKIEDDSSGGFPLFESIRIWNPDQYTESGRRLLPYLYGAIILQVFCYGLLVKFGP